jgi:hypothetical protein
MQFLCQQVPDKPRRQLQRQGAYFAPRLTSIRLQNVFWCPNADKLHALFWCNFAPK